MTKTLWKAPAVGLTGLVFLGTAAPLAAQPTPPCGEDPAFGQLDFWVGSWTVSSGGEAVGRNLIRKVQGGCAIEEHWVDVQGGTGQSLFYYLPATGTWRQVWVTPHARAAGGVKEKERVEAPNGSVRFQGTIRRADGTTYLDRTTLTPLPGGRARQHIEVSTDEGRTWRTTFDAEYRPVAGGSEGHPEWSPDGELLAFGAVRDGQEDVYVARVDASAPRRLTRTGAMESYPRFSADGLELAFLRRGDSTFTSHIVDLATGRETPLVPLAGVLEPAFAPDGRRVAFRSYVDGTDTDGEVVIADRDDGSMRALTDNEVEDGYPSFSADGTALYFHRRIGGHAQVMRVDLKSGEEAQLTEGEFDSWHAHESPDGTSIVFDSERHGHRDIFLMDLGSRSLRRLTSHPGRDGYPKFSPDGLHVAFHSDRSGRRGIYILDLRKKSVRPFTPAWASGTESGPRT